MRKKVFLFLWVLIGLIGFSFFVYANGQKEEITIKKTENGAFLLEASDISLEWMVEGDGLHITVTAPTTGWIAVGFKPSKIMKDANFIIGYVSEGEVYIEDHFGFGTFAHKPDTELGGTRDVTLKSGSEENGATSLSFALPLSSGDEFDREITPGEEIKVLLAYGADGEDNFTAKHRFRTSAQLTVE